MSYIKFSRTERFEVHHKHAIKSKNNQYLHLLPQDFEYSGSVSFVSQYIHVYIKMQLVNVHNY